MKFLIDNRINKIHMQNVKKISITLGKKSITLGESLFDLKHVGFRGNLTKDVCLQRTRLRTRTNLEDEEEIRI